MTVMTWVWAVLLALTAADLVRTHIRMKRYFRQMEDIIAVWQRRTAALGDDDEDEECDDRH